uniref:RBR-type E3 ubiquitin transferase n=1 Tax=Davidia involucrata TaxID=16924 RepID=A0A5B7B0H7_DAVIN
MFSGLIPGLNSVNSPEDELPFQFPPLLRSVLNLHNQSLSFNAYPLGNLSLFNPYPSFLRRESSDSGVLLDLRTLIIWSTSAVIFLLVSVALLLYSNKKSKSYTVVAPIITEAPGESPESDAEAATLSPIHLSYDALFNGNEGEIVPISDVKYAEELQVQVALLASLQASQVAKKASSSAMQASPILNPELSKIENEIGEASQSFCEICLDNKEGWQMFRNESCSHSFCYDCTSKHIMAKIQANIKTITCPGVDCKSVLDFNACRLMIPKDILAQWDESLCKSIIIESQILYCPFRDCSAMLVDDSDEVIREIKCPACRRSFCALCRVPWHLEFTCEEFQKLNVKEKGGEDEMVEELAKKKNWRKCPHCKYYVEKTEGCLHITCRCGYEFCYRCGSKWTGSLGSCCRQIS